MIEVRFHGRGGQGAVIASTLLGSAGSKEGLHVQSFPLFGFERRGAPVTAFARLDTEPILLHCQVYTPDIVVVLDPSLVKVTNVAAGLKQGGWLIINSEKSPAQWDFDQNVRVATVDATGIAEANRLGSRTSPIVNTAILGALARCSGIVQLESVVGAVEDEVPTRKEANVQAVRDAFNSVVF